MLATASVGAIWSSCSPDFGEQGVIDRFGQIEPKVLFCVDGYFYNGKTHNCLDKIKSFTARLPSLKQIVIFDYASLSNIIINNSIWNLKCLYMVQVPLTRVTTLKDINPESIADSKYVVYWMISFKRIGYNFALQRAVEWANQLSQPLLILEPLILDYPMSSIRFHKFTLEGMKEVDEKVSNTKAFYYPFVEQSARESEGLLTEISKHASVVITDDYPTYFVPQMTAKASGEINTRYELVDSNGIVPIRLSEKEYVRAHDFRRYLHKNLEDFIIETPT